MDPIRFSAEEVLDMAIRIEENGERFYSDAARMSKKDNVRELLNSLAQEEFKHKKYFMELKSS
ncbi:MAG: ferritin family protein, partial [Deltaproteobacteria bacterium]